MAEEKKKKQTTAKSDGAQKAKSDKGDKGKSKAKKGKEDVKSKSVPKDYIPRLRKNYFETVVPEMKKKFGYKNPMLVPRLEKIVLNVGIGTLHSDAKLAESIVEELTLISGQKPVLTKARKSIANFKLRDGMIVGCRVTLRHHHMYEFLDRLITIVIPRIRDFRGVSDRSFDGRGNYTFGIKEQIIFPEIDYDRVVQMHGMDLTIATSAKTDEEALELLKLFGFPFRQRATGTEGKAA